MNNRIRYVLVVFLFFVFQCSQGFVLAKGKARFIEAEKAIVGGGASVLSDNAAAGEAVVQLEKAGQRLTFTDLPKAGTLAIKYASVICNIKMADFSQS